MSIRVLVTLLMAVAAVAVGGAPAAAHGPVPGGDTVLAQTIAGMEVTLAVRRVGEVPGPLRVDLIPHTPVRALPIEVTVRSGTSAGATAGSFLFERDVARTYPLMLAVRDQGPHWLELRAGGEFSQLPFRVQVPRAAPSDLSGGHLDRGPGAAGGFASRTVSGAELDGWPAAVDPRGARGGVSLDQEQAEAAANRLRLEWMSSVLLVGLPLLAALVTVLGRRPGGPAGLLLGVVLGQSLALLLCRRFPLTVLIVVTVLEAVLVVKDMELLVGFLAAACGLGA
ncbi:hypothetical protein [Actinoplanes sp. NPDC089786]|uniref:hypothetical protein n=1 Tax=Actinoplanes sp. NPDC089786 TaxID=3155185 RepID=UPI00343D8D5D